MQRYFIKENYHDGDIFLTGDGFHHAAHVMRMKTGQEVYLVFQDEVAVIASLVEILPDALRFTVKSKEIQRKELPSQVTIACGLPKGEKLEWIVQKGTELGAAAFLAFPAASSVVKWEEKKQGKKLLRLNKIAQEAAEQSHRVVAPEINFLPSVKALASLFANFDAVVIAYEEAAKVGEGSQLKKILTQNRQGKKILGIFGPEGGFSKEEILLLEKAGGLCCGLGPRILRAETAPLYFLSAASYEWELI